MRARWWVAVVALAAAGVGAWWSQRDPWYTHGFDARSREWVAGLARQSVHDHHVAGVTVLLHHRGERVFAVSRGHADMATERLFTEDTPLRIASMTKPILATAALVLVHRRAVDLDVPVDRWIPELSSLEVRNRWGKVPAPTLRQLLTHTAGLPGNAAKGIGALPGLEAVALDDVALRVAEHGLIDRPGVREKYSGYGYSLAALVIERAMDRPFPDALREVLLEPLGMGDTTYFPSASVVSALAVPYRHAQRGMVPRRIPPVLASDDVYNAAGGLISTPADLERFWAFHAAGGRVGGAQLLDPALLGEMYAPAMPGSASGMGFNLDDVGDDGVARAIEHGGASGVYGWVDFDNEVMGLVLSQTSTKNNRRYRWKIIDAFTRIVTERWGGDLVGLGAGDVLGEDEGVPEDVDEGPSNAD